MVRSAAADATGPSGTGRTAKLPSGRSRIARLVPSGSTSSTLVPGVTGTSCPRSASAASSHSMVSPPAA